MINRSFLLLIAALALASLAAEASTSFSTPLEQHEDKVLFVSNVTRTSDDVLCVTGSELDTDEAKTEGVIQLVSVGDKKIKKSFVVRPPKDFFQNRFVGCAEGTSAVFAWEEIDTQSSASLNQSVVALLSIRKSDGRIDRRIVPTTASRTWVIGSAKAQSSFAVLLGQEGGSATASEASMRLVTFDDHLAVTRDVTVKNGAYQRDAAVAVFGDAVYVVGVFSKDVSGDGGMAAASKISLNGKYIWSKRYPMKTSPRGGIFPDRGIYLWSNGDGVSTLREISFSGVEGSSVPVNQAECGVKALISPEKLALQRCSNLAQIVFYDTQKSLDAVAAPALKKLEGTFAVGSALVVIEDVDPAVKKKVLRYVLP